jgi:hypothetical protein
VQLSGFGCLMLLSGTGPCKLGSEQSCWCESDPKYVISVHLQSVFYSRLCSLSNRKHRSVNQDVYKKYETGSRAMRCCNTVPFDTVYGKINCH